MSNEKPRHNTRVPEHQIQREKNKHKPTDFKSTCCNASVIQYEAAPKEAQYKHWTGHQCVDCGNNAPLSGADLVMAMGLK